MKYTTNSVLFMQSISWNDYISTALPTEIDNYNVTATIISEELSKTALFLHPNDFDLTSNNGRRYSYRYLYS